MSKKEVQIDNLNRLIKGNNEFSIVSTKTATAIIRYWVIGLFLTVISVILIPYLILKIIGVLSLLFLTYFFATSYRRVTFKTDEKTVSNKQIYLDGKYEYEKWIPKDFDKVVLHVSGYVTNNKLETIINMNGRLLIKCDDKQKAERILNLIEKRCPEIQT